MPKTLSVQGFTIDELSESPSKNTYRSGYSIVETPKDKARNWFRESSDFDGDSTIEWMKAIGASFGITIERVLYSGFYSQGDGACFEGEYRYETGWRPKLLSEAPQAKDVLRVADALAEVQKRNLYGVVATVRHVGRYYHEHCTEIDVTHSNESRAVSDEDREIVVSSLKSLMRFIYCTLEESYDDEQEDEYVDEQIRANEYLFTAEGSRCFVLNDDGAESAGVEI